MKSLLIALALSSTQVERVYEDAIYACPASIDIDDKKTTPGDWLIAYMRKQSYSDDEMLLMFKFCGIFIKGGHYGMDSVEPEKGGS